MKIELKQRLIGGVVVVIAAVTLLPFFILHRSHSQNPSVNLAENQQVLQIKDSSSDNNDSDTDFVAANSDSNSNTNTDSNFSNTAANGNDNDSDTTNDLNNSDQQTAGQGLSDNGSAAVTTAANGNGTGTSSEDQNPLQAGTDDIASNNLQTNSQPLTAENTSNSNSGNDVSTVNNTQTANTSTVAAATPPPDNSAFITTANQTIATDSASLSTESSSNPSSINPNSPVGANQNETTGKSSVNSVAEPTIHTSQNVAALQSSPKLTNPSRASYAAAVQNRYIAPSVPSAVTSNNNTGQWVVQVGSYSQEGNAQKMLIQLQQEGLAAYSQPSYLGSGQRIIRVYAGPFSQERALEVKRELHIDGIIIRRNIS